MAAGEATKGFKSPMRALVRSFRLSRDRWKQKYMNVQKMNKTLKVAFLTWRRADHDGEKKPSYRRRKHSGWWRKWSG